MCFDGLFFPVGHHPLLSAAEAWMLVDDRDASGSFPCTSQPHVCSRCESIPTHSVDTYSSPDDQPDSGIQTTQAIGQSYLQQQQQQSNSRRLFIIARVISYKFDRLASATGPRSAAERTTLTSASLLVRIFSGYRQSHLRSRSQAVFWASSADYRSSSSSNSGRMHLERRATLA